MTKSYHDVTNRVNTYLQKIITAKKPATPPAIK
jgi:hypothetical protein